MEPKEETVMLLKLILEEFRGMNKRLDTYHEHAKKAEESMNYELRRIASRIEEISK